MSGNAHIYQSLAGNLAIAAAKGVAAVVTGSGAMLAETIHSTADCGNQLLLLVGVNRSRRPPDARHPLGYGRDLYFWSFIVALLIFTGGGVFSVYEGFHKLEHPEPVEKLWLGVAILLFSLALEGGSTLSNLREMKARRGATPLLTYLRQTKDSDLVVVFGENAGATLGLLVALASLGLSQATGDLHWDSYGSIGIGIVLIAVAIFLAIEVKSLLVGESADPAVLNLVDEVLPAHEAVTGVIEAITIQQGPGEVMLAVKLGFRPGLDVDQVCDVINAVEADLRRRAPELKWIFVEPDRPDGAHTSPARTVNLRKA